MKKDRVIKKNPDVVSRTVGEETILMPLCSSSDDIDCIYTLNDAASRVWQLCDGKNTLGLIQSRLLEEFDSSPDELEKELDSVISDLVKIRALS